MYCSNCGSQVKPELNYCSRCGMRVAKNDSEAQKSIAENLSSAVGYIGGFGLLGFIFVTLVLVKNGIHPTALVFISLFYLASLFGICFLILQQIKNLPGKSRAEKPESQNDFQNEQLNPADTAQLEAPREPFISVTENTTKTLDEVLIKRG
jgi:uncharacterized membrane protein YvbJ